LRAMITSSLPGKDEIEIRAQAKGPPLADLHSAEWVISRKGQGEAVKVTLIGGKETSGTVVVWVHPRGADSLERGGKLVPAAEEIIRKKGQILAVNAFLTVDQNTAPEVNKGFAGYTFGYNRPILSNRVHDILTAVGFARGVSGVKTIHLVGFENAGPWVVLARGLCGDAVARTAADLNGFRFEQILSMQDEMMLPGALKYGGLPVLSALCAPHELYLHNAKGTGSTRWLESAYQAAGKTDAVQRTEGKVAAEKAVGWMLR